MRRTLRTIRGQACYRLHQTVEPVIGQIAWNRGLHQVLMRGLAAARTRWRSAYVKALKLRTAGLSLAGRRYCGQGAAASRSPSFTDPRPARNSEPASHSTATRPAGL